MDQGQQQTLAELIRAKYPGVYGDMTDAELESAIIAKYPGKYDDLPRSKTPEERQAEHRATKIGGSGYAGDAGTTYGDIETPGKQALGHAALDLSLGYATGGLAGAATRSLGRKLMIEGAERLPTFTKVVKEEVSPIVDRLAKPITRTWNEIEVGPAKAASRGALPALKNVLTSGYYGATGRPIQAIAQLAAASPASATRLIQTGSRLKSAASPLGFSIQGLISALGAKDAIDRYLGSGSK